MTEHREAAAGDAGAVEGAHCVDAASPATGHAGQPARGVAAPQPLSRPTLTGGGVLLRAPEPGDAADWLACDPDPELRRMYGAAPGDVGVPKTEAQARGWYERLAENPLAWVIEADGRCVGAARLDRLDPANRRATYAIGIFNRDCWGRGLGTAATRLVLRLAFECLLLHRVDLRVLTYNERAIRCYRRCGFTTEGIEREGVLVGTEWAGDALMSILEQEYRQVAAGWPREPGADLERWWFGGSGWGAAP